jgi:CubicO group peptidase (beta-lactamase class C family)
MGRYANRPGVWTSERAATDGCAPRARSASGVASPRTVVTGHLGARFGVGADKRPVDQRARARWRGLGRLLVVALLAVPVSGARPAVRTLDAYLQRQVEKHGLPGLVFALARADGATEVLTYGAGITSATRFRLGSLSKTLTAALALRLVDVGQLELDVPVQHYLPGFTTSDPEHARRVTVRHLLNQTSGLADAGYRASAQTLAEVSASLAQAEPFAEPGAAFAYFNANYDLLGQLIETVSGQPFGAVMREQLFSPVGMPDALAPEMPLIPVASLAQGHLLFYGVSLPSAEGERSLAPSGGLIASGRDQLAFLGQLVAAEGAPPGDAPYTMGWFFRPLEDGTPSFEHSGDLHTFHADMVYLPDEKLAFVLLYNRQHLLDVLSTFPDIKGGVIATLRTRPTTGGVSARALGLALFSVTLVVVWSDVRRLRSAPLWAQKVRPLGARVFGVTTPLTSLFLLVLLPRLVLTLSGRRVSYRLLVAYFPEAMLLLVVTAVLGPLVSCARLRALRSYPSSGARL